MTFTTPFRLVVTADPAFLAVADYRARIRLQASPSEVFVPVAFSVEPAPPAELMFSPGSLSFRPDRSSRTRRYRHCSCGIWAPGNCGWNRLYNHLSPGWRSAIRSASWPRPEVQFRFGWRSIPEAFPQDCTERRSCSRAHRGRAEL